MPLLPPFNQPGNWWRGNLHTHTTCSDGKLTPLENIRWHAAHGYDWIAITDHNQVTVAEGDDLPILVLPGAEITAQREQVEYHIVAVGITQIPIAANRDVQVTIDAVNAAGGVCFIAHPYWHGHTFDDLLVLKDYVGIEIFNTGCWLEINKGHALVHWDALLRRGRKIWGLATDDSHFYYPDYGRGWVVVRTETCDAPSILRALRVGHFYSTMGPEIYAIAQEERTVTVRCSPVQSIYLIGDAWHSPHAIHAWNGSPLSEATFTLHPNQQYWRIEVVDTMHRSAWTNAYSLTASAGYSELCHNLPPN